MATWIYLLSGPWEHQQPPNYPYQHYLGPPPMCCWSTGPGTMFKLMALVFFVLVCFLLAPLYYIVGLFVLSWSGFALRPTSAQNLHGNPQACSAPLVQVQQPLLVSALLLPAPCPLWIPAHLPLQSNLFLLCSDIGNCEHWQKEGT